MSVEVRMQGSERAKSARECVCMHVHVHVHVCVGVGTCNNSSCCHVKVVLSLRLT